MDEEPVARPPTVAEYCTIQLTTLEKSLNRLSCMVKDVLEPSEKKNVYLNIVVMNT
jgi:hypothetical protein